MQLCQTHRQLLSRRTLRWYSAVPSSDTIPASDVQVPTRLKRPVANTFEGINIQNVVVPAKSVSHKFRNTRKWPSRFNGSDDQSSDVPRTNQTEHKKGMTRNGASSMSGWGDGLVSLSFASRLNLRQKKPNMRRSGTEPHPQEAQSRKQKSYHAQRPQMHDHRRAQKQQGGDEASQMHGHRRAQKHQGGDDASQMHGHRRAQKQQGRDDASQMHGHRRAQGRDDASQMHGHRRAQKQQGRDDVSQTHLSTDAKDNKNGPKASSMTRPKSTTAAAAPAKITKADTASLPSSSNAPATQHQQSTTSSGRKAHLATLSSTNLNALFRTTTNTLTPGISMPSLPASTTTSASDSARARVRNVLERSAGDYSRFLPRDVGDRKDASRLPALRAARNALAAQRDVSLEQRRVALHIIGRLVQPRREVRA